MIQFFSNFTMLLVNGKAPFFSGNCQSPSCISLGASPSQLRSPSRPHSLSATYKGIHLLIQNIRRTRCVCACACVSPGVNVHYFVQVTCDTFSGVTVQSTHKNIVARRDNQVYHDNISAHLAMVKNCVDRSIGLIQNPNTCLNNLEFYSDFTGMYRSSIIGNFPHICDHSKEIQVTPQEGIIKLGRQPSKKYFENVNLYQNNFTI